MNWLNLHDSVLDSPKVVGAEPVDRATWLFLLRFCIGQENGGRIASAKTWGDRKWQQLCRVTKSETERACELWWWEDGDLIVSFYPHSKEDELKKKREAGREGGKAKTQAKTQAARANGANGGRPVTEESPLVTDEEPKHNPSINPREGERKGKDKGKGKEPPPTPAAGAAKAEVVTADSFAQSWNLLPEPFPQVRAMTAKRKASFRERMQDAFWRENWREALEQIADLEFCRGRNDRHWIADVDFFLRPDSVAKIIEGKYGDHSPQPAYFESDSPDSNIPMDELIRQRVNAQLERRAGEGEPGCAEFLAELTKKNTP